MAGFNNYDGIDVSMSSLLAAAQESSGRDTQDGPISFNLNPSFDEEEE